MPAQPDLFCNQGFGIKFEIKLIKVKAVIGVRVRVWQCRLDLIALNKYLITPNRQLRIRGGGFESHRIVNSFNLACFSSSFRRIFICSTRIVFSFVSLAFAVSSFVLESFILAISSCICTLACASCTFFTRTSALVCCNLYG